MSYRLVLTSSSGDATDVAEVDDVLAEALIGAAKKTGPGHATGSLHNSAHPSEQREAARVMSEPRPSWLNSFDVYTGKLDITFLMSSEQGKAAGIQVDVLYRKCLAFERASSGVNLKVLSDSGVEGVTSFRISTSRNAIDVKKSTDGRHILLSTDRTGYSVETVDEAMELFEKLL